MPEDRRLAISSARMSSDEVARHTFGTTRRGFDPGEVRLFLEAVGRELESAAERERDLRDALAAAEHRAANPVLDEATLASALGQETARVLRSAHDAATEVVAKAEAEAARMRAEADAAAEQARRSADEHAAAVVERAEQAASELTERASQEATAALEAAREQAEAYVHRSREEGRAMVHEAQELRSRVLADLSRRRRGLHHQIEQLRAGRERLAQTIDGVRSEVDRIADELFRAEDEARLAAEEAGRQALAGDEAAGAEPDDAVAGAEALAATGLDGERTEPGAPPEAAPTAAHAVEEIFARLRAERPATGDEAPASSGPGAPSGDDPAAEPAPPGALGDGDGDREPEAAAGSIDAEGERAGPRPDTEAAGGPEQDESRPDPELARRDELLAPILANLTRRLKRALQDDQNDILDRLRLAGRWSEGVLAPADEHAARYRQASREFLAEAARAGAVYIGAKAEEAPDVDQVAGELAEAVVAPLRRRLEDGGADLGDDAALAEHVGSAFREWKGSRIGRLAGDHAVAAFASAVVSLSTGRSLRWVVDDDGAPCPDCDDNALAGAVAAGEAYPTGHLHPPAHAGCRCLLATALA